MKFIGALGAPQFEFCGIKRKASKEREREERKEGREEVETGGEAG